MPTYKTAQLAALGGIHPNTVRLYAEWGLIPKPQRQPNGYRVFTDFHLAQLRLARLALQVEVLQNGLRKKIIHMVKVAAAGDLDTAMTLTREYLAQLDQERAHAQEAIVIAKEILSGQPEQLPLSLRRKEVSALLGLSVDTLRNWEMNGLLAVKRKENGYRVYTGEDIRRLKLIRTLRCANYSLAAILNMLFRLEQNAHIDLQQALNTPRDDADVIAVCDRLIFSLGAAERNAHVLLAMLGDMQQQFE